MHRTLLAVVLLSLFAAPCFAQDAKKPKTLIEKVSYGIGLGFAKNLARQGVEADLTWLTKGIQDGLSKDAKPLLTDKEARDAMVAFEKERREKSSAQGEKNKAEGEKFLAANKKKTGVKTTSSGLQYQVIKEGKGATPKATDKVKVHYHGTLLNGKVFDSSVERGEPISFPLNGVIKGWTEGLQLMKVGGKTKFFIPSDLAYGARGAGGDIGPNSTLIFEVELLDIE